MRLARGMSWIPAFEDLAWQLGGHWQHSWSHFSTHICRIHIGIRLVNTVERNHLCSVQNLPTTTMQMSTSLRAETFVNHLHLLGPHSAYAPHTPYPLIVSHPNNEHHSMTSTGSNDHCQLDVGMLCTRGFGGTKERNKSHD